MQTKNTIFCLFLSILFYFISQTSFGQENYLPGYMVTLHGDTLHGYVDYRNWERNPNKVSFKQKDGEVILSFTPLDIRGFGISDEIYESAVIQTEISPVNTRELKYDKELDLRTDTGFLQTVVKGVKSLYFYKNKLGMEQFYIGKDSGYELLVYKKYLKNEDGRSVIVENKKYIGQLTIYLGECATLREKLTNADYQKNSLENIFLAYYKCTQAEIRFHKKTEKVINSFGVIAGASLSSLTFRSSEEEAFADLINSNYKMSVNFTVGLFYDLGLARNNRKWSICNEIIFTTFKVDGRYDDYFSEEKYSVTYTTLGYSYLKLNNMIRFKYPVGKFFIYLNAGISNGYAIIEKNYKKKESTLFTQKRVEEGKALNDTRRYELGFNAGLGTKFKRYSFEIRYENANGMSNYMTLKSTTNRLYLLLGFKF
ncbi:MAG: hypothetical protein Q8M08_15850 [Bacteroidales bacterium]|nr:hypothetical protein [Bacteroidales bacterium]